MKYFWVLLLSILPQTAFAACIGMSLQGVPATATYQGGTGEYEVFDAGEYMQTVNFQVGGGASILNCDYFVVLSAGSSGNASQRKMVRASDGAQINYNVYTTAAKAHILKNLSAAGANEVIAGSFPVALGAGQTNNHSLYWTAQPGQIVAADAARFQDTSLNLRLYTGLLLGVYLLADTETITFRAKAESSVDLSLVNTNGAFNKGDTSQTVDFGTLTPGENLSYDTMIRSNDGYVVTMTSQHAQKMQHETLPASQVDYTLTLDGHAVDLSSGNAVQAAAKTANTTAAGDRLPTVFTVGAMTGSEPAGNYRDIITVTISSN